MTHRLRRIACSPFAADLRSGRLDTRIGIAAGVLLAIAVLVFNGDHYWAGTSYEAIPHN